MKKGKQQDCIDYMQITPVTAVYSIYHYYVKVTIYLPLLGDKMDHLKIDETPFWLGERKEKHIIFTFSMPHSYRVFKFEQDS